MSSHDVIVVGGRAAGASTAMLLARAGARVLLLEKSAHGSDTVSTHGLMRAGVLQLSRWGLLDTIVAAQTPAVRRTVFHYAGREPVQVSLRAGRGVPALFAPRRHLLDRVLADAAAAAGADVRHRVTVTGLTRDARGRVSGVRAVGPDGRSFAATARLVIGADGLRSTVGDLVSAPVVRRGRAGGAILYSYYEGVPVTGYEWAYGDGAAAGLVPTNEGLTCIFVGTTPARLRDARRHDGPAAFSRLFAAAAPDLTERLASGRRAERLRGWSGVPGHVRRSWGDGWALVGDAGYFRDPITSHGITDALRDSELLARAVLAGLDDPAAEAPALARYQSLRDTLSLPLFEVSDRIAAYDWDLDTVQALLRQVSSAMGDELSLLEGLPGVEPQMASRLSVG